MDVEARFWSKVDAVGPCWLWTAGISDGYGVFWNGTKTVRAHRWAIETLVGPIPTDREPDHLCRVRACVNPDHLELVTKLENIRRGQAPVVRASRSGRCMRGHLLRVGRGVQHGCRVCRRVTEADYRARRRAAVAA